MAETPSTIALHTVERLYKRLSHRRMFARDMDAAYRGRHSLLYASEKFRDRIASRYRDFSDNWCKPVADAPAERQGFNGFRLSDSGKSVLSSEEKQLQQDWHANDMDLQASQGLLSSIITSRSFVFVWGDANGEPVSTWEHSGEVIVEYDPANRRRRVAMLKVWYDEDTEYAMLQTLDALWKFQRPYTRTHAHFYGSSAAADSFFRDGNGLIVPSTTELGGWQPRQDAADDTWPLPNPFGEVSCVEYANRPMLGGDPVSDVHGAMAMQHAVNLLWAYLFNAADHASLPGRVIMGEEPPMMPILDESGNVVGEKPVDIERLSEDRIMYLTGENAKIGQWDPANLEAFTPIIEAAVQHIAAQTRTPPHYLVMGNGLANLNADALKAAETGLVMKVREERTFWSPATRDVYRLMALARGNDAVAEQCKYGAVQWIDAENRSDAQTVDALMKRYQLGYPLQWIMEKDGLSDTEIERVMQMKKDEAEQDPIGALSRSMGTTMPNAPTDEAVAAAS